MNPDQEEDPVAMSAIYHELDPAVPVQRVRIHFEQHPCGDDGYALLAWEQMKPSGRGIVKHSVRMPIEAVAKIVEMQNRERMLHDEIEWLEERHELESQERTRINNVSHQFEQRAINAEAEVQRLVATITTVRYELSALDNESTEDAAKAAAKSLALQSDMLRQRGEPRAINADDRLNWSPKVVNKKWREK